MEIHSTDYTQCLSCKDTIHKDAIKCMHCGTFQNWRRYLGFSSSFLSVVLALISVSTVFMTVMSDSTKKKDSDVDASIVNWQRTFLYDGGVIAQVLVSEAFVTNHGNKPAAVKSIAIKGMGDKTFQYLRTGDIQPMDVNEHKMINVQIIEPGKTLLLKFYLKTSLKIKEFESKYSNAQVQLEVINFSGKKQLVSMDVNNLTPAFYE